MILILSLEIEFGFNLFLDLCGLRVLYIDQPSDTSKHRIISVMRQQNAIG